MPRLVNKITRMPIRLHGDNSLQRLQESGLKILKANPRQSGDESGSNRNTKAVQRTNVEIKDLRLRREQVRVLVSDDGPQSLARCRLVK